MDRCAAWFQSMTARRFRLVFGIRWRCRHRAPLRMRNMAFVQLFKKLAENSTLDAATPFFSLQSDSRLATIVS